MTPTDEWSEWRGERRSTRLGAPLQTQLDEPPPTKRARTVDSTASTSSNDATAGAPPRGESSGLKIKINGAARIKPTETAVETVAGKKRSKFWFYAVEPVAGSMGQGPGPMPAAPPSLDAPTLGSLEPPSSGQENGSEGTDMMLEDEQSSSYGTQDDAYQRGVERSVSPGSSMDES